MKTNDWLNMVLLEYLLQTLLKKSTSQIWTLWHYSSLQHTNTSRIYFVMLTKFLASFSLGKPKILREKKNIINWVSTWIFWFQWKCLLHESKNQWRMSRCQIQERNPRWTMPKRTELRQNSISFGFLNYFYYFLFL